MEQKRLSVSYAVTMTRTDVSFAVGTSDQSYIGNTSPDDDGTTIDVTFHRSISPRLDFGAAFQKVRREAADTGLSRPDKEDTTVSAWLNRSLTRELSVAFAWSQYERRVSETFDETRYELRFEYSPTESSAAAMRSVGR